MGELTRKFLANYTILVAGDLASKFLLFWASVRMAHVLGTDLFGEIAFAAAFTAYFSLLISQGLGTYGLQEVARQPSRIGHFVGSILALRLCASLIAGATLGMTVLLLQKPSELKILLLLYGLLFFTSAFGLSWTFQALEQMKSVAIGSVITQLAFAAGVLIFLKRPGQVAWIPVFQFGGELLSTLFLIFLYNRQFGSIRLQFDLRVWSAMWKESLPIGLAAALTMVLYNFDIVLMGFLQVPAEVGQYSAAYKFINFFAALLMLYSINLFPSVSRCRADLGGLIIISDRSLKYTMALSIPLAAGGMLVARPLMELVFGPLFSRGAGALQILFWIIPIMASRAVYRATLLSHGFQRDFLWIALFAAGLNTGLNLVLIPRYSFIGAAATSLIGELLILFMVFKCVEKKVVRLSLGPHLWRPAVACIPMVLYLLWYEGGSLPLLIGGGFAVYMAAAWAVGAINPREIWTQIRPPESKLGPDSETLPDRF